MTNFDKIYIFIRDFKLNSKGWILILVVKKVKIVLMVLLTCISIFSLMALGNANSAVLTSANQKRLPVYSVASTDNKVALTFDAAWGADKTSGILDILDEYDYKATFFLVGFWIDKHPEMTKEIFERGHLIGNHSNNHLQMSKLSTAEIQTDLKVCNDKLKNITGEAPAYFRPPFGDYNNNLINQVELLNMQTIQWDVDSHDWMKKTSGQISERVLSRATDGSIVLFHNNSDYILEVLPIVILGLKNKGYEGVRLDDLVLKEDYYIDVKGVQHKK